jgi:hypothetical protein
VRAVVRLEADHLVELVWADAPALALDQFLRPVFRREV